MCYTQTEEERKKREREDHVRAMRKNAENKRLKREYGPALKAYDPWRDDYKPPQRWTLGDEA